jgi:hypothetical protein
LSVKGLVRFESVHMNNKVRLFAHSNLNIVMWL